MQLLSEEYGLMSPKSMEAQGLINATEYQKIAALTQSVSSDAHKKISGTNLFNFFSITNHNMTYHNYFHGKNS